MNTHITEFYEWFAKLGGSLSSFNDLDIASKPIPLLCNNLKSKSSEIKEKYNHKFKEYDVRN
jgi:hypothetical protein